MKAEARRRDHASRTHAESEHLLPGNSRVSPRIARGGPQNFIAKVKRESGAPKKQRVVLLLPPSNSSHP
jgi:hypothetical protein